MSDRTAEIDSAKPHSARMYDYFLGGKNHFAADREAAAEVLRSCYFVRPRRRAAETERSSYRGPLPGRRGVRQFLDIGTGLPTTNNVHQVAQAAAPTSRVVYTDYDPLVLAHARALLSAPKGPPPHPGRARSRGGDPCPGRATHGVRGLRPAGRAVDPGRHHPALHRR